MFLYVLIIIFCSIGNSPAQQLITGDVNRDIHQVNRFERAGHYEQAVELCEQLYAQKPGDRLLVSTLSRLYRQVDAVELAAKLSDWLKNRPNDQYLHQWLGEAYLRTGEKDKAHKQFQWVLDHNTDDRDIYSRIASSYSANSMIDEAIDTYRKGRVSQNDPTVYALEMAQLFSVQQQYDRATTEYMNWLTTQKSQWSYVEQRLLLMLTDLEKGSIDSSQVAEAKQNILEAAREVVAQNDSNEALQRVLGDLYVEVGRDQQAFLAYSRIEELVPQDGKTLLDFGDHCRSRKRFDTAIAAYQKLIDDYPKSRYLVTARFNLADTYLAQNQYEAAIEIYHRIEQAHARTTHAQLAEINIANVRLDYLNDPVGALTALENFVTQYPHSKYTDQARYRIGEAKLRLGRLEEAADIWCTFTADNDMMQKAVQLVLPGQPQSNIVKTKSGDVSLMGRAAYHCALTLMLKKDFSAGADAWDNYIKQYGADDLTNDALEWSFFLTQYAQLAPNQLSVYLDGYFLEIQHRYDEAIATYQLLVQLPDSPDDEHKPALTDYALLQMAALKRDQMVGFEQAAIYDLQQIVAYYPESPLAPRAQMMIADIYAHNLLNYDQAILEYEFILTDFPNSIFVEEARRQIQMLSRHRQS